MTRQLLADEVTQIVGDSYLRVKDVAAKLDLSEYETRRLIRLGDLRAVRLRGSYRVPASALAEFITARTCGGSR